MSAVSSSRFCAFSGMESSFPSGSFFCKVVITKGKTDARKLFSKLNYLQDPFSPARPMFP